MEGSLVAYKVFTNGSVLNASEINDNLMNQSIIVFSNEAARTAAITSPIEGMVTYLEDTASYESYDGAAWIGFGGGGKILQVVSVSKSDAFTTAMTTYQDVTGLSLSITPSSATSKILISSSVGLGAASGERNDFRLMRDSTAIAVGDSTGVTGLMAISDFVIASVGIVLDTPNTTSAITYKAQIKSVNGTNVYVNRRGSSATPLTFSSLIAMEVAG
jgi:hypothetical protein